MYQQTIDSPLGPVQICASERGISKINFGIATTAPDQPSSLTALAANQLQQYFAGNLRQFSLPLATTGTTFQQQVWQALCKLPFGQTCSYADIARQIANPKAVRAVGAANGKNPIAIVVPCHRVIGANGTLTGYAGGLDNKAWLLAHEQKVTAKC
ncbi:methylated-DNA-[protein]-cysteine S-methyltransferase [Arsukibacterium tuosuense]|uniref:Methylated-DNA--protein-cysteine methyltransferase n=1 Tax=Arsukibacterium tuosuense TaxID=1323745 RepID=A0A285J109_9GAMM|nr:methylated-DNA--[protein]-cysteine S-methyltransferase [Arsukibacterium tuosuense]SNY53989.1 methylated-DNA-[protein]-cysteine S-methyltransferase [Arsukibacterium tuosuense]